MLHRSRKYLFIIILLVGIGLIMAACTAATPAPTEPPTQAPAPTCPAPAPCPTAVAGPEAPFQALWEASPHNDAASEAFVHWDERKIKWFQQLRSLPQHHRLPGFPWRRWF